MDAMQGARLAYGVLIRTPILGPFVRLPLRLLRWWRQSPERDPTARADRLSVEIQALHDLCSRQALAQDALRRDLERTRLILFMLSDRLGPAFEQTASPPRPVGAASKAVAP